MYETDVGKKIMKQKIFREYDIRGIVGEDFTPDDARQLGKIFGSYVYETFGPRIVVGRDGRLSSPLLGAIFTEGLVACGVSVIDIGLVPTPLLYFVAHHLQCDGAVMITGSHNPSEYNGFKIMVGGKPFCGEDLQHLYRLFSAGTYCEREGGTVETSDWSEQYLHFLQNDFQKNYGSSSLRIAWDCGNGATGDIVSRLLQSLPGTHVLINASIDGNFPSHHPDPTDSKNMQQLLACVQKEGCDFGVGFDGDGDRIGVIAPNGTLLLGDQLMSAFSEEVLHHHPGSFILADIKSSHHLFRSIAKSGGKPVMCRTGHSHIKLKMKELGAPLAGEMSGHIMFADRAFGFDDAIYAALRFIGIFSTKSPVLSSSLSFQQWLKAQPHSFKTQEIQIPSEDKFQCVERLKMILQKEGETFQDIDGIRKEDEKGWWLMRASNTQEIIVVRIEADTLPYFKVLQEQVKEYLHKIGLEIAFDYALAVA